MITRWMILVPFVFLMAACERHPSIPADNLYEAEPSAEDPSEVHISPGTLEAENRRRARGAEITVTEAVRGYRVIHGVYPETLDELAADGPLDELPDLPEGYRYDYNSEAGEVRVVTIEE